MLPALLLNELQRQQAEVAVLRAELAATRAMVEELRRVARTEVARAEK